MSKPVTRLCRCRAVDRRFNRARYDADQTVVALAAGLKDDVDLDSVRDDLAGVVHQVLEAARSGLGRTAGVQPTGPGPARTERRGGSEGTAAGRVRATVCRRGGGRLWQR